MDFVKEIENKRKPKTSFPVLKPIKERFSPRVFSQSEISDDELRIMFEAARLAPSGRNNQPWFYYLIRKGTEAYETLKDCIPERNHWSLTAPVIIIACYDPFEKDGTLNKWAQYDLGASVISFILQAKELGYYCRQIGSFFCEKTQEVFHFPINHIPFILITLGKMGTNKDYSITDKAILEKELTSWFRKEEIYKEIR